MKLIPVTSMLLSISVLGGAPDALAWGERGHHTVCEVATKLVKGEGATPRAAQFAWQRFMLTKGHIMGHVCNLPDISWRNLKTPEGYEHTELDPRVGDEAHFVNPESVEYKDAAEMPLDYLQVEQRAKAILDKKPDFNPQKDNPHVLAGSNWWRTQQLYASAIENGKKAVAKIIQLETLENSSSPRNGAAEKKQQIADFKAAINTDLRQMVIDMGLMGHFIGDAAQPWHNTSNYNGHLSGHGGIHSYYESKIVDQIGADIQDRVFDAATDTGPKSDEWRQATAQRARAYIDSVFAAASATEGAGSNPYPAVLARMKKLSADGTAQIGQIQDIEREVITAIASARETNPELKTFVPGKKSSPPKHRPYPDELARGATPAHDRAFKAYRELIISQMATSASLLAKFWDEIYVAVQAEAQRSGAQLIATLEARNGRPLAAAARRELENLEVSKYYTTWEYPLDARYKAPNYLKLSYHPKPGEPGAAHAAPPPPGMGQDIPAPASKCHMAEDEEAAQ